MYEFTLQQRTSRKNHSSVHISEITMGMWIMVMKLCTNLLGFGVQEVTNSKVDQNVLS